MPTIQRITFKNKIYEKEMLLSLSRNPDNELLFKLLFCCLRTFNSNSSNQKHLEKTVTEFIYQEMHLDKLGNLLKDEKEPFRLSVEFDESDYNFCYEFSKRKEHVSIIHKPKKQLGTAQLHYASDNADLLIYGTSFLSLFDNYYTTFPYRYYFDLLALSSLATRLRNPDETILIEQLKIALDGEIITEFGRFYYLKNKSKEKLPLTLLSRDQRLTSAWLCRLQVSNFGKDNVLFVDSFAMPQDGAYKQLVEKILTRLRDKGTQIISFQSL